MQKLKLKIISEATVALIYQKAEGFAGLKIKFASRLKPGQI